MTRPPLASSWDEAFVQAALDSGAIDTARDGVTPVWHAAYFGQASWVERLLDAGARPDVHDLERIERDAGANHVVMCMTWNGSNATRARTMSYRCAAANPIRVTHRRDSARCYMRRSPENPRTLHDCCCLVAST
jgi:hypothetical protein